MRKPDESGLKPERRSCQALSMHASSASQIELMSLYAADEGMALVGSEDKDGVLRGLPARNGPKRTDEATQAERGGLTRDLG
ncbi:hypothetical protein Aple_056520 [Acrocarpospora pleiomorpha]|uniref:Uncharacterized protein n=1 Tax=Acrocarpospora pleiomorpha TaxID=90975 RepID=A0A5M3XU00_9ACTN|nr:hypothetical protein Aple_056520 [Acrocarpospora pleiomorpha]